MEGPMPASAKHRRTKSSRKRNCLEQTVHQHLTKRKHIEILKALRSKLQASFGATKYNEQHQSFWLDMRWLNDRGETEGKLCALSDLVLTPEKWKMLVYGKPLFGKRTFCWCLASSWASDDEKIAKDFAIVYVFTLSAGSSMDLEAAILKTCYDEFVSDVCSEDEFRDAWRDEMSRTLLILDGYDRLNDVKKLFVRYFIEKNEYFSPACVLVTSRPDNCTELRSLFNVQADICGLTEEALPEQLGMSATYSNDLENFIRDCKVGEMYGVAPVFTQAIAKLVGHNQRPKSLYDLLDGVINLMAMREGVSSDALDSVGMFLFDRLKQRKFLFDQKLLVDLLQKQMWERVQRMSIFVEYCANWSAIAISHFNFMVYLAVRYLRRQWVKFELDCQRKAFLQYQLCLGSCSEEYFMGSTDLSKQYYAGMIPEIVFEFGTGLFQMIQDVPCGAVKSAFETASILLRVDRGLLPLYGITGFNVSILKNLFQLIQNSLILKNLTVASEFYKNDGSQLLYVKFAVVDELLDNVVLLGVASENPLNDNILEEAFLDFRVSAMQQIHPFLSELCFKLFRSSRLEQNMRGPELVHSLVLTALDCDRTLLTRISLGSGFLDPSRLVTCEVISNSKCRQAFSLSYTRRGKTRRKVFRSSQCKYFRTNRGIKKLLDVLKISVGEVEDMTVTICIKTKFCHIVHVNQAQEVSTASGSSGSR